MKYLKKPCPGNLFFTISILTTIVNYVLLGFSYYIQNNTGWAGKYNIFGLEGLVAWNTAILISEISLFIIVLCLVSRIVLICIKKINLSEFLIGSLLNIIAFCSYIIVIFNRI